MTGTTYYTAHVEVEDNDNAAIIVENDTIGYGTAEFRWRRMDADKLDITVVEEGYQPLTNKYRMKDLRVGAFICDWVFPGIPGLIVDGVTGAWFEPKVITVEYNKDMYNKITQKIDNKNFLYKIRYERRK